MGLSSIPILTFLIACLMIYYAITRFNKDRKAIVGLYFLLGACSLIITIQRLNGSYFKLSRTVVTLLDISIDICIVTVVGLIFYAGWTNKKNANAKKIMILMLTGLAISGILLLIAFLI